MIGEYSGLFGQSMAKVFDPTRWSSLSDGVRYLIDDSAFERGFSHQFMAAAMFGGDPMIARFTQNVAYNLIREMSIQTILLNGTDGSYSDTKQQHDKDPDWDFSSLGTTVSLPSAPDHDRSHS